MKTKPTPHQKAAKPAAKPASKVTAKVTDPGPTNIADGTRTWIPTKQIDPHPHNRQIIPESCRGLADSMSSHGQIQPVTVRPHPTKPDRYQLGAGARRWHAAKLAGLSLDCIVRDLSDAEIEAMLAIENLQRENPEPREEAAQIRRLFDLPDSTPASVAAMLGKPDAWVKRRMRLLSLIDPVHEAWQDPDSGIYGLSIATMELVAALSPELQLHFHSEWGDDGFDTPTHANITSWIADLSCSLKDVKWLDNPATFVEGCGAGGCATSRAATDLFSNTEFADAKESKCAQCLNPACFNKRKDLAHNDAWQTAIAKAPEGYYVTTDSWQSAEHPITLADGSTLKLRREWDFQGWKNCKKTDPNAKPFLEEKNGAVKLIWKTPPANSSGSSQTLPKPAGQADLKTPEESTQASIDRLQGKRYTLVLAELRAHVGKAPMPQPDPDPRYTPTEQLNERMLKLAATFGTNHSARSACTTLYEDDAEALDEEEEADESEPTPAQLAEARLTAWQGFRQLDTSTACERLWKQIRRVLLHRLATRSYTDRKSDLIKDEFISELHHIATLTRFDFAASYLKAAAACKPPASLKHLNPTTLKAA